MTDAANHERARALMMCALDGEITPAERRELRDLTERFPELETEWRRLARVKEVTTSMTLQKPPEEVWDRYWVSVYRRSERAIAWAFISAGTIVLVAYWLWNAVGKLLQDQALPVFIRVAIVGVAVGAAILIVSVLREKLFMSRRDPYQKEIIR